MGTQYLNLGTSYQRDCEKLIFMKKCLRFRKKGFKIFSPINNDYV